MEKKKYALVSIFMFVIGIFSLFSTHNIFITGGFFLSAGIIGITNVWRKNSKGRK